MLLSLFMRKHFFPQNPFPSSIFKHSSSTYAGGKFVKIKKKKKIHDSTERMQSLIYILPAKLSCKSTKAITTSTTISRVDVHNKKHKRKLKTSRKSSIENSQKFKHVCISKNAHSKQRRITYQKVGADTCGGRYF